MTGIPRAMNIRLLAGAAAIAAAAVLAYGGYRCCRRGRR